MKRSLVATTAIPDGDYVLSDGKGWFETGWFAIHINRTDEGVVVDVYKNGDEMSDPIVSCYAFDGESSSDEVTP